MAGTSERQAACGRHGGCLPLVMWTATTVADCRFHKLSLRPCALWPMPPGSGVVSDLYLLHISFIRARLGRARTVLKRESTPLVAGVNVLAYRSHSM